MKVIMLSGDAFILDPESNVHKRIIEYGTQAAELHVLVLSKKIPNATGKRSVQISSNVWVYPVRSSYRVIALIRAFFKGLSIIRKIKSNYKKDIITAQDPFEIGLLGWMLSIISNLPLQLQVHNDFYNPYFLQESRISRIRTQVAEFLLPRANGIRVVNQTIKDLLTKSPLNITAHKIDLLPVYIDTRFIHDQPASFNIKSKYPQFSRIILMVGRLGKQKNYPFAFKVLKQVINQKKDVGIVLLGEGNEEIKLNRIVKRLGLSDNVMFEGRQNDIVSYYKGADIFLHASNYEGYGMVFVEAATAMIPMVSTNVGIMGNVFINEESALISGTGEQEPLTANIVRLLENAELSKSLALNAYQAMTMHTYQNKEQYLEKYRESWHQCLHKS